MAIYLLRRVKYLDPKIRFHLKLSGFGDEDIVFITAEKVTGSPSEFIENKFFDHIHRERKCPACRGSGEIIFDMKENFSCPVCKGKGKI